MRNKLAPESRLARVGNLLVNAFWAVVWLGRWTIRMGRRGLEKVMH